MPMSPDTPATPPPLEIVGVEDHDLVREELVAFLQRPDWRVRGVGCAEELDAALRQRPADLLVVDLNLPGEDGLSICQRLRRALPELGLVLLTARILPQDKTVGYQSGADVYLTKPANVGELEAAISNLARRIRQRVAAGPQLDLTRLTLGAPDGAQVSLTLLESRLLYELTMAPGRQLSTEMLLRRLDPGLDQPQLRNNLPVTVSRLRSKIATGLGPGDIIKAIRGFGYQLSLSLTVRG